MRYVRSALCRDFPVTWLFALTASISCPAVAVDGYYDQAWPDVTGGGYFSFNGDDTNPFAPLSFVGSLSIEANGNVILAGGITYSDSASSWWAGELSSGGSFVPSFGLADGSGRTNGCAMVGLCNEEQDWFLAQPLGDGRNLVLGAQALTRTTAGAHAAEASVPIAQVPINDLGGYLDGASFAPLPGGGALVVGEARLSPGSATTHFGAARLTANLALDTSFNARKDGTGVTYSGGAIYEVDANATREFAASVFRQADGRSVLVGITENSTTDNGGLAAIRINEDGSLDPTYGTAGKLILHWPLHRIVADYQLYPTIDRAGRIVVSMVDKENSGMLVARITPDGALDFFTVVRPADVPAAACDSILARTQAIDSAGRILAVGRCVQGPIRRFAVVRLRGDTGGLDTSFGLNGVSYGWYALGSSDDYARAIGFDASGHPLVAGWTYPPDTFTRPGMARLGYDLIFTNNYERAPRGCLPPDCD